MMDNNTIHKTGSTSTEGGSADRVVINVGGMRFETHRATLQNISDTRLAWLTENSDPNTKEQDWFFDRHPGAFVYILNFYRTGKLHIPTDMCGPAFEEELTFWGIDEKQMEPCCWETFTRHREAEENLKNFEGPGFDDLRQERRKSIQVMRDNGRLTRYYDIIWKILDDPHSSKGAKIFSLISCFMIILSVSGYCLSTVPSLRRHDQLLENINYICVVFFTIECTLRLITTPSRKEFMFDYNNWIDFISVVPSYLVLILKEQLWVKNLVIIRLLRVFKFFKLSYGLQVLLHTLKASSHELTLLLLMLLIPVVIFSCLVYAIESNLQPDGKFTSIPTTFWWCIITMTTVGYGDLTPKTWGGQVIGTVCAIFGLLTVALPISVIGGNFSLYYAHVRARLKLPQKNRRHLQVNMHGLLRQTTSLSSRDRDRKLLRRNQISQSQTSKSEPKRFLDKLFNKPQDSSPKLDINAELSPIPPRLNRGRALRRTALMNADSSDNESNEASVNSSPFLKPEETNNLIPNPIIENVTDKSYSFKKVPDKRISVARGRMRRTALINVESSDNESVESSLSTSFRGKFNGTGPLGNGPAVMRKVSNTSVDSSNQNREELFSKENSLNLENNISIETEKSDFTPRSIESLQDHSDTYENLKQEIPVFEVDPGGTDESCGIDFDAGLEDYSNEDYIMFKAHSQTRFDELYLNLDKLKTLSKSLDERMFYDEVPNDGEKIKSPSRRNSMKMLTDCDQAMDKVNNENESPEEKNHSDDAIINLQNYSIFPKRGSIPLDRKRNRAARKSSDDYGSSKNQNILNSLNNNFSNSKNRYRNENGRNEKDDIFNENRTNNNILTKNVSLPVDVCMTRIDDIGNKNDYSPFSEVKIETDLRFKKKLARKSLLRNKMKSEGDEDSELLSPTYLNNFRRMRKESIV